MAKSILQKGDKMGQRVFNNWATKFFTRILAEQEALEYGDQMKQRKASRLEGMKLMLSTLETSWDAFNKAVNAIPPVVNLPAEPLMPTELNPVAEQEYLQAADAYNKAIEASKEQVAEYNKAATKAGELGALYEKGLKALASMPMNREERISSANPFIDNELQALYNQQDADEVARMKKHLDILAAKQSLDGGLSVADYQLATCLSRKVADLEAILAA